MFSVRRQCGLTGADLMYSCIRYLSRFRSATSICPKFASGAAGKMLACIFKNVLAPNTLVHDWRTITFFWNSYNPNLVYCDSSNICHAKNYRMTRDWLVAEGMADETGEIKELNKTTAKQLITDEKCCGIKAPSGRKICYYADPLLHPCISRAEQRSLLQQRQIETHSRNRSTSSNSGPVLFTNYCAACMTAAHFITAYKFSKLIGVSAWLINYAILTGLTKRLRPACTCKVETVRILYLLKRKKDFITKFC